MLLKFDSALYYYINSDNNQQSEISVIEIVRVKLNYQILMFFSNTLCCKVIRPNKHFSIQSAI